MWRIPQAGVVAGALALACAGSPPEGGGLDAVAAAYAGCEGGPMCALVSGITRTEVEPGLWLGVAIPCPTSPPPAAEVDWGVGEIVVLDGTTADPVVYDVAPTGLSGTFQQMALVMHLGDSFETGSRSELDPDIVRDAIRPALDGVRKRARYEIARSSWRGRPWLVGTERTASRCRLLTFPGPPVAPP